MSDKERIKQYLEFKGISKNKFYSQTGLSVGFLDSGSSLGVDKARIIINKYPDISLNWLIMGEGEMLSTDSDRQIATAKQTSVGGIPLIPIEAIAGVLSGNSTQIMDRECEHYNIPMFQGAEFLIRISGDSMLPKYYSGDIVACKRLPIDTFFQWNKVYVLDSEQGVIIKRVRPGRDNRHVTLISENTAYAPFELPLEKVYSIALVIGVVRAE